MSILVDLDGTLALYDGWKGKEHIGEPVPAMLFRVRNWIENGEEVRIFTARASDKTAIPYVRGWLKKLGLGELEITNTKDFTVTELWDDRAVQVEPNTGKRIDGKRG